MHNNKEDNIVNQLNKNNSIGYQVNISFGLNSQILSYISVKTFDY